MENTTPSVKGTPMLAIVAIVAVVLLAGGVYLMMNNSSVTPNPAGTSEETMVEVTTLPASEETTAEGVKTINLEAGSFYYKPAEITVKKGEKVKIVLKSADMMHDFNIDELDVKIPITKSGETGIVEFTPEQAGIFEYYCSVGKHRANGQVGKITVEE